MSKRVLITGSNGQLGKTLKDIVATEYNQNEYVFVGRSKFDITDFNHVANFLNASSFDYIINCAAYTNVEKAEDEPEKAFLINAEAVENLAIECKKRNIVLIHISTDYVFDGENPNPYLETDNTNPINTYGASKRKGEELIELILQQYYIVRTSWLYSIYKHNFVATISDKIKADANLKIVDSQYGTPTSSIALSRFLIFLTEKNIDFGTYHFSAKGETTWYDFALEIASYYESYDINKISPINTYITKAKRPQNSVLNNSKALRHFENIPHWKTQLEEVIDTIIENGNIGKR